MRYAIGSISKQFTATAILLLQEDGRLSIDDPVAKWFPELTRAGDITLRNLMAMTSGYQDYWPHDYVFTAMRNPASIESIAEQWAGKELDFEPGSRWQYSNTNYVILGAVVERVSGMPLMDFLRQRIFIPLGMNTVADVNAGRLGDGDAQPLARHAMGPLRAAPKEAPNWLFGTAQLAMTAGDLARWDIAVMRQQILKPESYREQQRVMLLSSGLPTSYGFGVTLGATGGRRQVSHGGAVSGYTSTNRIFPDDSTAIVVFTNIYPGAADAPGRIADRIAAVLFPAAPATAQAAAALESAKRIYEGLMKGTIDRSLLTPNAGDYFTAEVLADYAASLGPLGAPAEFVQSGGETIRGGLVIRSYRIRAGEVTMQLTTMARPDGRLEQYIVARAG